MAGWLMNRVKAWVPTRITASGILQTYNVTALMLAIQRAATDPEVGPLVFFEMAAHVTNLANGAFEHPLLRKAKALNAYVFAALHCREEDVSPELTLKVLAGIANSWDAIMPPQEARTHAM